MILTKVVVFAALCVALAVNLELIRHDRARRPEVLQETHHEQDPNACALDPMWQCTNTRRWHACLGQEACILAYGVAI